MPQLVLLVTICRYTCLFPPANAALLDDFHLVVRYLELQPLEDTLNGCTIFYMEYFFLGPNIPQIDGTELLTSPTKPTCRRCVVVLPSQHGESSGDGQRLPAVRHGHPGDIESLMDGLGLELGQELAVRRRDTTTKAKKPSVDGQRLND